MSKILAILDGLFNQAIPFLRYLVSLFKTTPVERERKIDENGQSEEDQAARQGRPKWD